MKGMKRRRRGSSWWERVCRRTDHSQHRWPWWESAGSGGFRQRPGEIGGLSTRRLPTARIVDDLGCPVGCESDSISRLGWCPLPQWEQSAGAGIAQGCGIGIPGVQWWWWRKVQNTFLGYWRSVGAVWWCHLAWHGVYSVGGCPARIHGCSLPRFFRHEAAQEGREACRQRRWEIVGRRGRGRVWGAGGECLFQECRDDCL